MVRHHVVDSLVQSCESLYFQTIAMESILDKVAPEDWRHMMDTMLSSDEAIRLRASFRQTLEAAVLVGDPATVVAALRPKLRHPS